MSCDPKFYQERFSNLEGGKRIFTIGESNSVFEEYGFSLFVAFRCNPFSYVDLDGRDWKKWVDFAFRIIDLFRGRQEVKPIEHPIDPNPTPRHGAEYRGAEPRPLDPTKPKPKPKPKTTRPPGKIRPPAQTKAPGVPKAKLQPPPWKSQRGASSVGLLSRFIQVYYLWEMGGRDIILGGLGIDLEARERYAEIFELTPEQKYKLRQQREAVELENLKMWLFSEMAEEKGAIEAMITMFRVHMIPPSGKWAVHTHAISARD